MSPKIIWQYTKFSPPRVHTRDWYWGSDPAHEPRRQVCIQLISYPRPVCQDSRRWFFFSFSVLFSCRPQYWLALSTLGDCLVEPLEPPTSSWGCVITSKLCSWRKLMFSSKEKWDKGLIETEGRWGNWLLRKFITANAYCWERKKKCILLSLK